MEVIGSIYTGVTADFQRGVYPIARCVKAEQHDLGVVMADVNVLGSFEAKFESTNRIYDVGGCSPTLSTMQGGNQEPKILESQIVAMRGRNPDNPSDRTTGSPTEQRLEINMQGTSNCLTSVQKDNMVLIKQATKSGSIECEVGGIGGEEDGVVSAGELADPEECKTIAELGVDFLAAGIGNIHGKYPANWPGLSFETLAAVKEKVGNMPLVLHGGTGIPEDMIKKAISLGVAKINVNTECQLAFAAATRKYIEEGKDLEGKGFDPRKLLAPGSEAIKETVREKINLFGSAGKA